MQFSNFMYIRQFQKLLNLIILLKLDMKMKMNLHFLLFIQFKVNIYLKKIYYKQYKEGKKFILILKIL